MKPGMIRTAVLALAVVSLEVGYVAVAAPRRGRPRPPLTLNLAAGTRGWAQNTRPSGPVGRAPIPNFGEIVPGCVYRSGQPTEKGYQWLKEQGFRGIVCLRREHDNGAEAMAKYGLKYLRIPITDYHAPTIAQGEEFVKFAANRDHWPLLVHCAGGMGRAGCMAALIRYSFDGWPMTTALREATRYRPLNWPIFGGQRQFLERWARTHPRGGMRPTGSSSGGG
jgi:tyrosine-protein phosphatase SIW14